MKRTESESFLNDEVSHLVISAAVGTLLGASVALLFAPKSGKKLRHDICEACEDISDRSGELAHDVIKRSKKAARRAADYVESFKEGASNFIPSNNGHHHSHLGLLVGALGGGLLGATAAHYFGSNGEDVEEELEGYYEKLRDAGKKATKKLKSFHWVDTAKNILESISPHVKEALEEEEEELEEAFHGNSKLHNAIEWATLGWNVLQKLKSRR